MCLQRKTGAATASGGQAGSRGSRGSSCGCGCGGGGRQTWAAGAAGAAGAAAVGLEVISGRQAAEGRQAAAGAAGAHSRVSVWPEMIDRDCRLPQPASQASLQGVWKKQHLKLNIVRPGVASATACSSSSMLSSWSFPTISISTSSVVMSSLPRAPLSHLGKLATSAGERTHTRSLLPACHSPQQVLRTAWRQFIQTNAMASLRRQQRQQRQQEGCERQQQAGCERQERQQERQDSGSELEVRWLRWLRWLRGCEAARRRRLTCRRLAGMPQCEPALHLAGW